MDQVLTRCDGKQDIEKIDIVRMVTGCRSLTKVSAQSDDQQGLCRRLLDDLLASNVEDATDGREINDNTICVEMKQ